MNEKVDKNTDEKEKKVIVYFYVAKFPPGWGGTEYWIVIKGDGELVDIVKSVARHLGYGDFIPGNSYGEQCFVYILKEQAFQKFRSLWNEQLVHFEEVDSDRIVEVTECY